ncbi:hypothetical protein LL06_22975 [Hoeflea sp. BAL378]|uniref:hypothetical protein n=1 Tax=Hoeflea sp. BAL378 TaxID=1547437 RepID=UPI0005147162|nr:hypothetical protein [Hoeflea sp. BAL378]KGF67280.1 hypothetical protein LL06_22975 [Hoeflea sp. BAL378]
MTNPIDPTLVRQGRLGRQVLVILVASLMLAFMSAWVLWSTVSSEASASMTSSPPQSAAIEPKGAKTSGTILASE